MRMLFRNARIVSLLSVVVLAPAGMALAQGPGPRTSAPITERLGVFPAGAHIASLDFRRVTAASSVAKAALDRVEAATQTKASELAARAKLLEVRE